MNLWINLKNWGIDLIELTAREDKATINLLFSLRMRKDELICFLFGGASAQQLHFSLKKWKLLKEFQWNVWLCCLPGAWRPAPSIKRLIFWISGLLVMGSAEPGNKKAKLINLQQIRTIQHSFLINQFNGCVGLLMGLRQAINHFFTIDSAQHNKDKNEPTQFKPILSINSCFELNEENGWMELNEWN